MMRRCLEKARSQTENRDSRAETQKIGRLSSAPQDAVFQSTYTLLRRACHTSRYLAVTRFAGRLRLNLSVSNSNTRSDMTPSMATLIAPGSWLVSSDK
jgi:hypothetical protein